MSQYEKHSSIIQKLILQEYPNEHFEFYRGDCGFFTVIINNHKPFTILPDHKWDEVKRCVNKIIHTNARDHLCEICFNHPRIVLCNKCANYWCGDCYIDLFRIGHGIIKCPYCRYEFGKKFTERELNKHIDEIKRKIERLDANFERFNTK